MRSRRIAVLLILAGLCGSYSTIADAVQSGTGFAVGDGSSVITNFHVVDGCKSVRIANVGDGRIKTIDPGNDIAIIQSARPIRQALRFRTGEPLKPGEDIILSGFR
jgi:serine protease Do